MQLGVTPVGGMTVQGSARFIINAIETPDYTAVSLTYFLPQVYTVLALMLNGCMYNHRGHVWIETVN